MREHHYENDLRYDYMVLQYDYTDIHHESRDYPQDYGQIAPPNNGDVLEYRP